MSALDSSSARASLARDLRLAAVCVSFRLVPPEVEGDLAGRLRAAALEVCPHPRAAGGKCPDCGATLEVVAER